jgi:vacuolar-type H+-ATPase subunit H
MSEARKYEVRSFVDAMQFKKDVSYSSADLSGAMETQAALFAHYGELHARAARQVDDLELLLENAEAKVYRMLRDDASKKGEKVTEAMLEKFVSVHPQVVQFKRALNEARQIEATAKVYVEAFRNRKDMLVQQGAQAREEYKGEVFIAARSAGEEYLEEQKKATLHKLNAIRNARKESA